MGNAISRPERSTAASPARARSCRTRAPYLRCAAVTRRSAVRPTSPAMAAHDLSAVVRDERPGVSQPLDDLVTDASLAIRRSGSHRPRCVRRSASSAARLHPSPHALPRRQGGRPRALGTRDASPCKHVRSARRPRPAPSAGRGVAGARVLVAAAAGVGVPRRPQPGRQQRERVEQGGRARRPPRIRPRRRHRLRPSSRSEGNPSVGNVSTASFSDWRRKGTRTSPRPGVNALRLDSTYSLSSVKVIWRGER